MSESVQAPVGPREVLARFQRAAIERSLTDMLALYSEDAVHEFPFTRPGLPSRLLGREQIRDFLRANWETTPLPYTAYRNVVVHETTDSEVIVVEQDATGTAAPTGRDFALPNIVVLRVRAGRIVHIRDYVNLLAVTEAVGSRPVNS